jgi:hypothetical protein
LSCDFEENAHIFTFLIGFDFLGIEPIYKALETIWIRILKYVSLGLALDERAGKGGI